MVVCLGPVGYNHDVPEELIKRLRTMPDAKKIALAIYGESVAAYRYSVLAEKSTAPEHRTAFEAMKAEELGHQAALERLAAASFPDGSFVLSPADKDLIIAGTRMLDATSPESFRRAMQFLHDTELRTGRFYDALHELMPDGELGAFLKAMASECYEHGASLLRIKPPAAASGSSDQSDPPNSILG